MSGQVGLLLAAVLAVWTGELGWLAALEVGMPGQVAAVAVAFGAARAVEPLLRPERRVWGRRQRDVDQAVSRISTDTKRPDLQTSTKTRDSDGTAVRCLFLAGSSCGFL